jgi:hypothetical protein
MFLSAERAIDPLLTYRLNPFPVFYLGSTRDGTSTPPQPLSRASRTLAASSWNRNGF